MIYLGSDSFDLLEAYSVTRKPCTRPAIIFVFLAGDPSEVTGGGAAPPPDG
jgi:hypothetical protein